MTAEYHCLQYCIMTPNKQKDDTKQVPQRTIDIKTVRKLFASWFPDESVRHQVIELIADDIATAAAASQSNWSVTLPNKKYVRLNVGSIELVMVTNDLLHLVVDAEDIEATAIKEIAWRTVDHSATNKSLQKELQELEGEGIFGIHGPQLYPSVPGAKGIINMSTDTIASWLPGLRDRHLKLLARASATRPGQNSWASSHVPAIIDYLNEDLGLELPQPTYIKRSMTTPIVKEAAVLSSSDAAFSADAFDLLALLNDQPVKATYLDRKEEFQSQLEQPFKELLTEVASRLPAPMHARLETEKKTTSRILKNDYGKGGAWSFFWGAFYPKEGKRTESPQLYVSIFNDVIDFGFAIGDYGGEQQNRFISACKQYPELLRNGLAPMLSDGEYAFGRREETIGDEIATPTFAEWLADPSKHGIQIRRALSRSEILRTSRESLADQIASVFIELYPLLLLAADEKPQAALEDWLGLVDDDEPDVQPPYTLDQCSEETGLPHNRLMRWVNAINRKGQAIIYGPPGTGKTFLAEHLARHIVADGDGLVEILQFHPAYSYEEFMQGIRPQLTANGALDYSMKRGRFLSFCEEAAKHSGMSVLIIDEINRANLARVFGELMYLLEYRNKRVPLAGGGALSIPGNVRIIGTMNTADRSIALVDHALRRRFAFLELRPEYDILEAYHRKHKTEFPADKLVQKLKMLNNKINDPHYEVGISYFLRVDLAGCIEDIWRMEIEPYLQEYFFDQPGNAKAFAWEEISNEVTTQ